ncbi:MAG: sugar phosphate isomerase/epimerase family protein [Cytophagales bacterium]|nr:sugar phosphate isomerase/epimerase [Bernardetiaceae bacterium]MDW8203827.1 sugar phosphate isomerase/epimerase family protein [Cytophagales bacterium]
MNQKRREFIKQFAGLTALSAAGIWTLNCTGSNKENTAQDTTATVKSATAAVKPPFFKISLAEWSLHKTIFAKQLDNLDFPIKAKQDFGIEAVEYVSIFFKDKAKDTHYLTELRKRCEDNGVTSVLIMIDAEGNLADTDAKKRMQAVENHYKWVEAAKFLGCHSIRVNSYGEGTAEQVKQAAIDGLGKLTEFGIKHDINIIVENHGGYSSNGKWLADVIATVNKNLNTNRCGTLPDFGNFCTKYKNNKWQDGCEEEYDRYTGISELMPFAKGVSAKSYDFDEQGNETKLDYKRLLKIVKDAGYNGYIGVEYEGTRLSEPEGIRATKALLEKLAQEIE